MAEFVVNLFLTAILLGIFIISGHAPDIYWLQIPLYALMSFLLFTTWSLFAGMLSVISKDFMHLVRSTTTALFWFSGILYDAHRLTNKTLRDFLRINPVNIIVEGYRNALIYKVWFWENLNALRNYGIALAILMLLAIWVYRRTVRSISDIL